MANKMAEFPGKLAIFWQKAASLREAARGGVSPENLKTQGGGYFGNFRSQGGGILAILVDPWLSLNTSSHIHKQTSL